jgi:DNA-binding FrmR family transcriptional regulator
MAEKNITTKDIINHISRLEGQLSSVKRDLEKANPDCERASNTLSAASRSFASLRRSFFQCFVGQRYMQKNMTKKMTSEYSALLNILNS